MTNQPNQEQTVICTYSTKEAVKDGVLFLLPKQLTAEAGIKFPVYVSAGIYHRYIQDEEKALTGDVEGRTWDLLSVFKAAARNFNGNTLRFSVVFGFERPITLQMNEKRNPDVSNGRDAEFWSKIGPEDFDNPSPAIFIYQIWED